MWQWCLGSDKQRANNPGLYASLAKRLSGASSLAIQQIELDLRRTFPNNPLLDRPEDIDRMRRVLGAYSLRSPDIGYCQSMNFIVATLYVIRMCCVDDV